MNSQSSATAVRLKFQSRTVAPIFVFVFSLSHRDGCPKTAATLQNRKPLVSLSCECERVKARRAVVVTQRRRMSLLSENHKAPWVFFLKYSTRRVLGCCCSGITRWRKDSWLYFSCQLFRSDNWNGVLCLLANFGLFSVRCWTDPASWVRLPPSVRQQLDHREWNKIVEL